MITTRCFEITAAYQFAVEPWTSYKPPASVVVQTFPSRKTHKGKRLVRRLGHKLSMATFLVKAHFQADSCCFKIYNSLL